MRTFISLKVSTYWLTGLLGLMGLPAFSQEEREWEISRFNRREARRNYLTDSLMQHLENNTILSVSYGNYFLPETQAASEKETYINMRDSHRVVNIALDKFLTNRISLGAELGLHFLKQDIALSGNRVKGGGGSIITTMVQLKSLFPHLPNLPRTNLYALAGSGFAQTLIVSINTTINQSSQNRPTPKLYNQTSNTLNLGVGMYHRLSKYVMADVSFRYFQSHPYSPYIGSTRSFSPFQIDIKLGGVLYGGFRRMEKQLSY